MREPEVQQLWLISVCQDSIGKYKIKKNKNNKHLNPLSAFNKKLLTFTFFSQVQLFKIYLIVFLTYLLQ